MMIKSKQETQDGVKTMSYYKRLDSRNYSNQSKNNNNSEVIPDRWCTLIPPHPAPIGGNDAFWGHNQDLKSSGSLNVKVDVCENKSAFDDSSDRKVSQFFSKYGGALKAVQQSKLHWKKVITGQAKDDKSVLCEAYTTLQQGSSHNSSYGSVMNAECSFNSQSPAPCDGLLDMSASLDLCSQFSQCSHQSVNNMMNQSDSYVSSTEITPSACCTSQPSSLFAGTSPAVSSDVDMKGNCNKRKKKETGFEADRDTEQLPHSTGLHQVAPRIDSGLCQVCDDIAAGFYCGGFVCEACKKFFIRASKQEKYKFVCLRQGMCKITKESRVQCQYCRFQKCCQLNMYYPGEGKKTVSTLKVSGIPCRVCGAPSSGFHFGALTCEGCKGFFRRMVKEREAGMYKCSTGGACEISTHTRNMCKACRFKKCINIGMSVEGSRIGRQPNAVKHAISLEVKKHSLEHPQASSALMASQDCPYPPLTTRDVSEAPPVTNTPSVHAEPITDHKEIKEESDPAFSFTGIELTEVIPGMFVKEEPQDLDPQEQVLENNLYVASEQLRLMCNKERAKSDVFDPLAYSTLINCWKSQMKHFEFHAQCLIRFVKKVPDFRTLPLDDQVVLLQNAIYPMVVLNLSRDYELDTGFFNFFNFSRTEARIVSAMCPEYVTLTQHFQHMGQVVKNMAMTEMELTLLSCIVLLDSDCAGLKYPDKVQHLQEYITNFFQNYEIKYHEDGFKRFGEMILRVSELVLAKVQHITTISDFLNKHPDLEVSEMFKEMFFS